MMIVEDIWRAVRPALEAILTPDELERTHLDVVTTKDEPVMSSAILKGNLLLRVIVHDEENAALASANRRGDRLHGPSTQRFAGFRRGE